MFCPKCGTLSFPTPTGDMTCTNLKCGYSGNASNTIFVHDREIDVSNVTTRMDAEEPTRGHRESGDSMSPFWDEPGVRLQSRKSEVAQFALQQICVLEEEEECLDCGAHVP